MNRVSLFFLCLFSSFSYSSYSDFLIKKIEIKGNSNFSSEFITKNILSTKEGEIVNENKLNKILKDLYRSGYFDNISIEKDEKNGVLTIKVDENRVIDEVEFEGLDKFSKSDIEKELLTKKGNMYSKSALKSDVDKLRITYQQFGYLNIKIQAKILVLENGKIRIIFDVDEGQNKKVVKAIFIGNKNISNFILYDLIDLKGKNKFNFLSSGDDFNQFILEKDLTSIKNEYLNLGFLDFKLESANATLDPYSKNMILTYVLNEGKRYKIGSTAIEYGIKNLDKEVEKKIKNLLENYNQNPIYNESEVNETLTEIKNILSDSGFPFANVFIEKAKKQEEQLVDLKFKISESQKVTIRKIEIVGNRRTKDYVLRREILIKEGDMYDREKIERSKDRLNFLGYFKTVEISEKLVSNSLADLVINVEEQFFGNVNFSAGYSTYQGLIGTINLQINNILGTGYSFSSQISRSGFMQVYSIGLFNPRVFNSDFGLGFDFSYSEYGSLKFIGSSYLSNIIPFSSKTFSQNIRTSVKLSDRLTYTLGIGATISQMSPLNSMSSVLYEMMYINRQSYRIFHSISYDKRNFARYATRGYYATYSEDYAGFNLLGNQNYIKRDLTLGFIKPFFNDNIIFSFSTSLGFIQTYGKSALLGYDSLYTMGYYDIRGFSFYGVGPRIEITDPNGNVMVMPYALPGKNYFVGTVDLASPLFIPKEYGVKFSVWCDFGTMFGSPLPSSAIAANGNHERILDSHLIRVAVGAGLVWQSPVGEIRIDFARPIIKMPYDTPMTFVIRFGNMRF